MNRSLGLMWFPGGGEWAGWGGGSRAFTRPVYTADGRRIEPTASNIAKYEIICKAAKRAFARALVAHTRAPTAITDATKASAIRHMNDVCATLTDLKKAKASQDARTARDRVEKAAMSATSATPLEIMEPTPSRSPLAMLALLALLLGGGAVGWRMWRKRRRAA